MPDTSCLRTTIKNTSGAERYFGFLPPHGLRLAADATHTFMGNIVEAIQSAFPGSHGRRHLKALETAITPNDEDVVALTIISTPAPVLYDEVAEETMIVQLEDGDLVTEIPCWVDDASVSP